MLSAFSFSSNQNINGGNQNINGGNQNINGDIQSSVSNTQNNDNTKITGNNYKESTWRYLRDLGYSKQSTAGIMGNMQQESGVDPTVIQGGGRGPAAGIVQWENYTRKSARWKSMSDYASSRGKQWTDLQSQLNWLDLEMKGKDPTTLTILKQKVGGYDSFKKLTDINKATLVFEQAFERAGVPAMSNRYKAAKGFYDKYNAYEQGTPWVPNDQIALIHKDEMIIPKSNNPLVNDSMSIALGGMDVDSIINILKWGFNFIGSKISNIDLKPTLVQQPYKKESKSDQVFSY